MSRSTSVIDKKRILFNSASGIIHKVLSAALLIWLYQYLIKRVPAEEYMLLPIVTALMMFAPLLAMMLTGSIGRFVTEAHAQKRDKHVTEIISTMFPILLIASIFIGIISCIFVLQIDRIIEVPKIYISDAQYMLIALSVSFILKIVLAPFGVGLWVYEKFYLSDLIRLVFLFLRIAILLSLFKFYGAKIIYVVYTSVGAEVASTVVVSMISYKIMPNLRFKYSSIDWGILKELFSFSSWNVLIQISSTLRQSVDIIVLNRFSTPQEVTAFHVGRMPEAQITQFMLTASGPVMPSLTALHATSQKERLSNAFLRVGKYSMFCVLFISVPVMIFAKPLFQLYLGESFSEFSNVPIVSSILLSSFPLAFANITHKLSYATGKLKPVALIAIIGSVVNVLLSIVFVALLHLGAVGAALSSLFVNITTIIIMLWFIGLKYSNLSFKKWLKQLFLPGIFPAVVGGFCWYFISLSINIDTFILLFISCVGGGVPYLITLILLLNQNERGAILALLNKHLRGRFKQN